MAKIPRLPQQPIFQPQTIKAPTQGFQALKNLFTGVEDITQKLSSEQIQADKMIGSTQIQSSIRNLQRDATLKFPGDFSKQQQFVNQGSQSFLEQFIPGSHPANRGYFKAISKNLLSEANFGFARNIEAQNIKNQKTSFNNVFNQNLVNTVKSIRNGNTQLTKDNIGQMVQSLNNSEKGTLVTPAEKQAYQQRMLSAVQVAGAKTHIDAALAQGGIKGANIKFSEIISDKNNPILSDPKTAASFTSQIRSYKNAVTAGVKASQESNKDQQKAILDNTRRTGQFDTQKVSQMGLEEKNEQALAVHNKSLEIFISSPLNKQKALDSLKLDDPQNVAVKKTVQEFENDYKKDKMGFILGQIAKSQFGVDLANATPEQQKQMRSTAVEIQRQRGDLNIEPATQAEIQPVIAAAQSGKINDFVSAYNNFTDNMGKLAQSGNIQLGKQLVKNGVDTIAEDVGYLDDKKGRVANNILTASVADMTQAKISAANKLGITEPILTRQLRNESSAIINKTGFISTLTRAKFISSIRNGAGNLQGVALGGLQQNIERYSASTISNSQNSSISNASQEYIDGLANSFNYHKERNGQFIRIPLQYNNRPLDQNKVINTLKAVQSNLKMKDIDFSQLRPNQSTSPELAQQLYWTASGSYNHWVNGPDGQSYFLMDSQNKTLNRKYTGQPIRVRISDIIAPSITFKKEVRE